MVATFNGMTVWTIQSVAGATSQVALPTDMNFFEVVKANPFIEMKNAAGEVEAMFNRDSIFMVTNQIRAANQPQSGIVRPNIAAIQGLMGGGR